MTHLLSTRFFQRVRNAWRILIVTPIARAYMAVEYFLLLFMHRKAIARAEVVTCLWFWSFGHQAVDLHMLALRFRGKKLLVLISDYQNFNPYIIDSFRPHADLCFLRHSWLMGKARTLLKHRKLKDLKLACVRRMLRFTRSHAIIVPEYHEHYGSDMEGVFITERIRLFQQNPDMRIAPLAEPIDRFRSLLRSTHPQYADKWFVSLYLRKKISGIMEAHRDMDPRPYSVVISRIRELGGFVLCGGDYDPHEVFPGMEGVLGYKDFPCDRALADYFFLTQPRFIVTGLSGPLAIAISFDIPTLITNCALYYYSGSRKNQIVLYKKLADRPTGRILSARECRSLPIVAFREQAQFEAQGLVHIDNTPQEISDALEEMVQRYILDKEIVLPEHQPLYDRFKRLLPEKSVAYQSPSRPALSYLQNLKW